MAVSRRVYYSWPLLVNDQGNRNRDYKTYFGNLGLYPGYSWICYGFLFPTANPGQLCGYPSKWEPGHKRSWTWLVLDCSAVSNAIDDCQHTAWHSLVLVWLTKIHMLLWMPKQLWVECCMEAASPQWHCLCFFCSFFFFSCFIYFICLLIFFYQGIVDIQYYMSFRCTMPWFTVFKGYTTFMIIKYWLYSLCCVMYPCSLFIWYISLNPLPPPNFLLFFRPLPTGNY